MQNFTHWFEIPATHFERAVTFYRAVFHVELKIEEFMGDQIAVFMPEDGSHPGCIMASPRLTPGDTGTRLYLAATPDVSTLLQRVVAAGGEVVLPAMTLPDGNGTIGLFRDSEGNVIGLHREA